MNYDVQRTPAPADIACGSAISPAKPTRRFRRGVPRSVGVVLSAACGMPTRYTHDRVLPVRVVGMHGVRHDAETTNEARRAGVESSRSKFSALSFSSKSSSDVAGAPVTRPQRVLRHRAPRALRRVRAHLLVVVVHEHSRQVLVLEARVRGGADQRAQRRVAALQVIEPPGKHVLVARAPPWRSAACRTAGTRNPGYPPGRT